MSKKDKAIKRLKMMPKDYSFKEMVTLLGYFGYAINNKGKTSGSRVEFKREKSRVVLHKPHDRNNLLEYELKYIIAELERQGLI